MEAQEMQEEQPKTKEKKMSRPDAKCTLDKRSRGGIGESMNSYF